MSIDNYFEQIESKTNNLRFQRVTPITMKGGNVQVKLPKVKRILRYLLQGNDEIRPLCSNL